ncbi:MAG TPA: carbohydrate-binding family 9-like protein [Puia sp.]|nr:carbohydrate-binding family 9-like protein [Puia sp.]
MKSAVLLGVMIFFLFFSGTSQKNRLTYSVKRSAKIVKIDGNWNKAQWQSVKAVELTNYMGQIPAFRPVVHAKMMYDQENLYVIFQVNDRYVHSIIEEYNGPVSSDACVEFFFSPDTSYPERYFNLEINAGGTPLMAYHIFKQKEYQKFSAEDFKKIEIAHSLPKKVDPEIATPVVWTVEYKLPFAVLEKYGVVSHPKPGVVWRANFYKTASKSSNPHYMTWSFVGNPEPNFHLPQFFGQLIFEK